MINKVIVNYLHRYKDKFELEDLKYEIVEKGYEEEEFEKALKFVEKNKVKSLPSINLVKPKKKRFSFGKFVVILFGVLILGVSIVILLNFFEYDIFGWNFFDFLRTFY